MGFIDDLLWNVGPDLPVFAGRRARRILERGEAATATVVGIEVERTTSSEGSAEPEYRYALDVRGTGGTKRVGVRQRMDLQRGDAHIGADLPVKILGEDVVIDWGGHLGRPEDTTVGTWRMVDPPAEGVEDKWRRKERQRIDESRPASITITNVAQVNTAFGPTENLDLDVQLEWADGGETETRRLEKVLPPAYARSLAVAGAVLPVGVDRDGARVTIDWETAARSS